MCAVPEPTWKEPENAKPKPKASPGHADRANSQGKHSQQPSPPRRLESQGATRRPPEPTAKGTRPPTNRVCGAGGGRQPALHPRRATSAAAGWTRAGRLVVFAGTRANTQNRSGATLLPESPEKKYKSKTRAFPPGQERARRGVTPSFWNLAVLQRATNRPPTSGAPSGTPDEERRFRSASRVRFTL